MSEIIIASSGIPQKDHLRRVMSAKELNSRLEDILGEDKELWEKVEEVIRKNSRMGLVGVAEMLHALGIILDGYLNETVVPNEVIRIHAAVKEIQQGDLAHDYKSEEITKVVFESL